jgi:predicted amidophosphoribosyltransferase
MADVNEPAAQTTTCPNCQATLVVPVPRFCPNCGRPLIPIAPPASARGWSWASAPAWFWVVSGIVIALVIYFGVQLGSR